MSLYLAEIFLDVSGPQVVRTALTWARDIRAGELPRARAWWPVRGSPTRRPSSCW